MQNFKNGVVWNSKRSLKATENSTIQWITYDFLLAYSIAITILSCTISQI